MPKISIIVPTYKRPNLLKRAVLSLGKQDFKDFEIIITDDHSNDETSTLVKVLQEQDSRIKYVLNTKYKQGPNGNKNNGLDHAKGEFVSFLDDDDELFPGALSALIAKTELGYSHVFGNCLIQKGENLSDSFSGKGFQSDTEVSKKDFLMQKMHGEFFGIFKRTLLENKRFDDEFYGNEAVLWVNLYKEKSFYIHKALRIYHYQREDSVTLGAVKNAARVYLGYKAMAEILENEFEKSKDKDYLAPCALNYKQAAYYAKFAGEFKLFFVCVLKSLKMKFNAPAFILLCLAFVPNSALVALSKLRVKMRCKD